MPPPLPRTPRIGQELLDVPFPDLVKSMGLAIAEAQLELDRVGVRLAQMMAGKYEVEEPDPDDPEKTRVVEREAYVTFDGKKLSLLELGFTPTFYQFVDTVIEVKVSLGIGSSIARERKERSTDVAGVFFGAGAGAHASAVSASYAAKYQYSAEGASLLRTKLVPVPPPAILEERIRAMLEREKARRPEA